MQGLPQTDTNLRKTNLDGSFESFTTWDKLEYAGDLTGSEMASRLSTEFGANVLSLAGETNYNPAKVVPLWAASAGDGDVPLSATFLEKFASGEEQKERSQASKRAAKAVLKKFAAEPLAGVSIAASPEDEYAFQVRVTGPVGSPYEGGIFLVSIKLPLEYPNVAPVLSFVTPIEHCNIADGVPCPGLLGLSSDRWSPKMTVHSVLQQLRDDLLNNQSKGDALRPELAAMDDAAFFTLAKEATAKQAKASQEFPPPPPPKKVEEKQIWAHDYIILRGEFENANSEPADLPRIKLKFTAATAVKKAGGSLGAAIAVCEPCTPDVEAAVLGMALELDGEPLKPVSCYRLQPERVALYAETLAPGLTASNAVAVTCTNESGDTIETVVNAETKEHVVLEDPIMMSELALPSLVEAQFEEGGAWTVGCGSAEFLDMEKAANFSTYAKNVSKPDPDCLSTLRQYLQKGPVTRLYSGGVDGSGNIHCGFTLRMPPGEVDAWSGVNGAFCIVSRKSLYFVLSFFFLSKARSTVCSVCTQTRESQWSLLGRPALCASGIQLVVRTFRTTHYWMARRLLRPRPISGLSH